jgi:hypothetical protein
MNYDEENFKDRLKDTTQPLPILPRLGDVISDTDKGKRSLRATKFASGKPAFKKACFIRRILAASNATKTIDNEMINLTKVHYLLF